MDRRIALIGLEALCDDVRLSLLCLLSEHHPDGLTPKDLSKMLSVPASTLSFHLRALEQAMFIESERRGRYLHYRSRLSELRALAAYLVANCCEARPPAPEFPI